MKREEGRKERKGKYTKKFIFTMCFNIYTKKLMFFSISPSGIDKGITKEG